MDQQLNGGSIPYDFTQYNTWIQKLFLIDPQNGKITEYPEALVYIGGDETPSAEDTTFREYHYSLKNIREAFSLQQYCMVPGTNESIIHALASNFLLNAFIAWNVPLYQRANATLSLNSIFQKNFTTALSFGETHFCKASENEIFGNVQLESKIMELNNQLAYQKNTIDSQAQLLSIAAEEQAVLKSAIDSSTNEQNLAIENLTKQFQQQYNELQVSTDAIVKEKNVTLIQEIEQLKGILANIQQDHQRELKKVMESNEIIVHDCNEKLKTTELLKNQEIEYMKEKCKSEVQEMRHQCTNQLQDMKIKCEKEIEKNKQIIKDEFQIQYDVVLRDLKTSEELNKQYQKDVPKLYKKLQEYKVKNNSLVEGFELRGQKLETQENLYTQQLATQKNLYEDKLVQTQANVNSLQQQVNLLTLQLTTKSSEFQTEIGRVRNEEKIDCTNQLTKLASDSNARYEKTLEIYKLQAAKEINQLNYDHKLQLELQEKKRDLIQDSNNSSNCIII